jgi:hypothetical protein
MKKQMIRKRVLSILVFLYLIVFSIIFSQTSQTGAIHGTVTDPDNVSLPGITVILKSPALVLPQLTTVTNASGVYRFPMLPPGIYELTFMLEGMNTVVRKDIVVSIGKTTTVNTGMSLPEQLETITVSGDLDLQNQKSITKSTNMDDNFLEKIPTSRRNYMDFFNMTPGVNDNMSHGSGLGDNAYNIDGVNMADPETGSSFVGFSMDILEEISVQTGGITAEYGQIIGMELRLKIVIKRGVINTK